MLGWVQIQVPAPRSRPHNLISLSLVFLSVKWGQWQPLARRVGGELKEGLRPSRGKEGQCMVRDNARALWAPRDALAMALWWLKFWDSFLTLSQWALGPWKIPIYTHRKMAQRRDPRQLEPK